MHPGTRATIHRGNWDLRETIGTRKTIRTVWTWKEDDRVHATAENVGEGSDMELSLLTCPPAFPMAYRGGGTHRFVVGERGRRPRAGEESTRIAANGCWTRCPTFRCPGEWCSFVRSTPLNSAAISGRREVWSGRVRRC